MFWFLAGVITGLLIILRFTVVEEGTAKIITRWGGVVKVFIQWQGYQLDKEGNIIWTGKKNPWYGGLRIWIGLPFVDKVYTFKLRWHSVEEVEGKRIPKFHEEIKNSVMLKTDRYWLKMTEQETADGQFPDVEWLIGLRVINPQKVIFKSPHNWVENALSQLQPLLRNIIRKKTLTEVLDLQREQIWKEIFLLPEGKRVINKVLKKEWGIIVEEKEIGIFNVSPPDEYQKALAAKSKMGMEAAAMAAETTGAFVEMIAAATDLNPEEIKKEINANSKLKERILKMAEDILIRKMGMDTKSYIDIRVQGAKGIERMLLNALALWQRMPHGSKGREREEKERKEIRIPTEQEAKEAHKRALDKVFSKAEKK